MVKFMQLKREIREHLPLKVLSAMKESLVYKPKELWASHRCNNFEEVVLYATLLKDIKGWSYDKICKHIAETQHFVKKTLAHNCHVVRKKLRDWSKTVLVAPSSGILKRRAKRVNRPKPCEDVTLWMDSTDCRASKKNSMSRKDPWWSYKCNSPGTRWNVMFDGKSRAAFVSGPHAPSLYDGDLAISEMQNIEALFEGETIIADNHYAKCKNFFKKVTFITPFTAAGRPKVVERKKVPFQLPPEKVAHNSVVAGVRGKVEGPFGWMKTKFSSLEKPFYEGTDQHDCLFRYALACHHIAQNV
jgi:hypothetical protein